jgi:hypothetical protein
MGCYEGPGPDINVLYQWWGTTTYSSTIGIAGISQALNLGPWCGNPLYQVSDFLSFYPQFGTPTNPNYVPLPVIQAYINFATSCLSSARWGASWPIAMAMFVAHYVTLYLQAIAGNTGTASALAAAGLAGGIIVSHSAGDVSESFEYPPGLENAGAWGLTSFGQQLFTMAKVVGMGMVYAW